MFFLWWYDTTSHLQGRVPTTIFFSHESISKPRCRHLTVVSYPRASSTWLGLLQVEVSVWDIEYRLGCGLLGWFDVTTDRRRRQRTTEYCSCVSSSTSTSSASSALSASSVSWTRLGRIASIPRRCADVVLHICVSLVQNCADFVFSALTLLVGRQEKHPACKN